MNKSGISTIAYGQLFMMNTYLRCLHTGSQACCLHSKSKCCATFQCRCSMFLNRMRRTFLGRLVTMNESRIYQQEPKTKSMSNEGKHVEPSPPKKAKVQKTAEKVFSQFFETVLELSSETVFRRIRLLLTSGQVVRCRDMLAKGFRLLTDYAQIHSSQVVLEKARNVVMKSCGILPISPQVTFS